MLLDSTQPSTRYPMDMQQAIERDVRLTLGDLMLQTIMLRAEISALKGAQADLNKVKVNGMQAPEERAPS